MKNSPVLVVQSGVNISEYYKSKYEATTTFCWAMVQSVVGLIVSSVADANRNTYLVKKLILIPVSRVDKSIVEGRWP